MSGAILPGGGRRRGLPGRRERAQDRQEANRRARTNAAATEANSEEVAQLEQDVGDLDYIKTYRQDTPPAESVGLNPGDLWLDSGDGNKMYRWDGAAWLEIQDGDIALALQDAFDAQQTADSKNTVFVDPQPPVAGIRTGDLWIDTDDGNRLYRWDGSTWLDAQDGQVAEALADAAQALSDAADAQATADEKIRTYYDDTPPFGAAAGDLWVDTDEGNRLRRYDGLQWVDVQDDEIAQALADAADAQATADGKVTTFYQPTEPTAEGVGDFWVDTDDGNRLHRWDGSSWVDVHDTAIDTALADSSQALADAADAQATADGKVTTFYQSTEPTADAVGDMWIDTGTDRLYRWDGSDWVEIQDQDIAQAISDAATAQSTADSKIETYYSPTEPTASGVGDLWVDTDDGNRLHRWDGSAWVDVHDAAIDTALADATQALSDAADAQAAADGKVTTFYQDAEPTAEGVGDLWLRTTDDRLFRWDGAVWAEIQDADIASAISDAQSAQATADSKIVSYYQASEPSGAAVGDLWYDTDDDNHPYWWNGSSWVDVRDGHIEVYADQAASDALSDANSYTDGAVDGLITTYYQSTEPTGAADGDLWIDTDDDRLYRWDGSDWVEIQDADIAAALADAADAQATADGKIQSYYQDTEPAGTDYAVGDLWFDTNDQNKAYRWNGASWESVRDELVEDHDSTLDAWAYDGSRVTISGGKIQAGTILAQQLGALTLDVGKFIRSSNHGDGIDDPDGWRIDANGDAEFNNVTVRGTYRSAFSGDRVEITQSEKERINFYDSSGLVGALGVFTSGTLDTALNFTEMVGFGGGLQTEENSLLDLRSYTATSDPVVARVADGTAGTVWLLRGTGRTESPAGTEAAPAISFRSDKHTGLWLQGNDNVSMAVGGVSATEWRPDRFRPGRDNTYYLGDTFNRWIAVYAHSGTINTSDGREKTVLGESRIDLDVLRRLRPVTYRWRDGRPGTHTGLVAQDVAAVLDDRGIEWAGLDRPSSPAGRYGLNYGELIAPIIAAVQELADRVEALEAA